MTSKKHTSASSDRQPSAPRSNRDSARWIAGLLLLFVGLFCAASVLFSFFSWDVDQSVLQRSAEERDLLGEEVENLCGASGARIGRLLVDSSFGVFGLLIPVMLILIGIRIIRQRPLLVNHSILSLFLILILGSLTLGFAFGDRWSLCSSTGWGGAFGIGVSELLHAHIGVFGTLILLLGGWILTGVFINRNFINTVNEAGNVMVDRGERIVETVRRKVVGHGHADEPFDAAEPASPSLSAGATGSRPEPVSAPSASSAPSESGGDAVTAVGSAPPPAPNRVPYPEPQEPYSETEGGSGRGSVGVPLSDDERRAAEVFRSVAAGDDVGRPFRTDDDPEIVRPASDAVATAFPEGDARPFRMAGEEESPFVELTPDGLPIGPEPCAADSPDAGPSDESPFTEVDLAHPDSRLVMGRGGLIELARREPTLPEGDGGPFTEISVGRSVAEIASHDEGAAASPASRRGPSYGPRGGERPVFEELTTSYSEPLQPEPLQPEAGGLSHTDGPEALGTAPAAGEGSVPADGGAEAGGWRSVAADSVREAVSPGVSGAGVAPQPAVSASPGATEGVVVTVEANEARMVDERAITTESYDPLKDLVNYRKPPVTLLEDYVSDSEVSDEEIFENKTRIEETLKYFGIPIQRIKATVGPTVTLYEIVQAQGVKISKIQGLQNDIAQSLKAESGIRIIAPIPGRGTIGIEVPNRCKQVVSMYSAIRSLRFQESKATLPVVIGRTIQNENFVFDLAKMPHLLVAGATGMGKSVGLNAIITSLLYRMHPAQLKFVMIDPKMVEFSLYAKLERHFLAKMESEEEAIVTDPKKAVYTLNALCSEMDNRLELCKKAGARNIAEYNEKFTSRRLNPMNGHRFLPYIVVVIDEFADLIMTAKEVEMPVTRLAQKARAIGIHLIVATQRPSVDVITGKIKANFPARIAFRVMQMIDSRTILDRPGADQLIGRGDMLISKDGELTRIQCAFIDTPEVERVVDTISRQQSYTEAYALPDYTPDSGGEGMGSGEESLAPVKYDALFAEIAREAVSSGQISTSMIQRNYEVGFNRAGRIMLQLERAGIVGRQQGAKPRDIQFHDLPSLEAKLQELGLS